MVCCQNIFGLCIIHSYFETVHISTIIIISIIIHNNNNNNNTYYIYITPITLPTMITTRPILSNMILLISWLPPKGIPRVFFFFLCFFSLLTTFCVCLNLSEEEL